MYYIKKIKWVQEVEFNTYTEMVMQIMETDIWYLCRSNYIRGYDCDDLAQELRLHLWKKLKKYNPKKAGINTWASRVLRNKITDMYRRTSRKNIDILELGHDKTISMSDLPNEI